jgi:hypothetical protein
MQDMQCMNDWCSPGGVIGVQILQIRGHRMHIVQARPGVIAGTITIQIASQLHACHVQGFSAEVRELVQQAALVSRSSTMRAIWPYVSPLKDDYM